VNALKNHIMTGSSSVVVFLCICPPLYGEGGNMQSVCGVCHSVCDSVHDNPSSREYLKLETSNFVSFRRLGVSNMQIMLNIVWGGVT